MSDYKNHDGGGQYEKPIAVLKQEAFIARRKVRRELPSPSPKSKLELAEILEDYRDRLSDHQDDIAIETPWEEREVDVDSIEMLLHQTVELQTDSDWLGRPQYQTMPKVAEVDARYLFKIGKELDAIAKELGFAATTRDTTPDDDADLGDLRSLLKARGQTQALKNLPGSGPEDDSAGGVGVDG